MVAGKYLRDAYMSRSWDLLTRTASGLVRVARGSYRVRSACMNRQSLCGKNMVEHQCPVFWQHFAPLMQQTFARKSHLSQMARGPFIGSPPRLIRSRREATYICTSSVRSNRAGVGFGRVVDWRICPRFWNERYESVIGVRPRPDADGVFCKTSWSGRIIPAIFRPLHVGNLIAGSFVTIAANRRSVIWRG